MRAWPSSCRCALASVPNEQGVTPGQTQSVPVQLRVWLTVPALQPAEGPAAVCVAANTARATRRAIPAGMTYENLRDKFLRSDHDQVRSSWGGVR